MWCEMCTAWPSIGILARRSVTHLSGLHVVTDGHVLVELIDPLSGARMQPSDQATGEGSSGTTLRRRAGMLLAVSHA